VAADELYDGPFCILSAVDNRCYKRILYDVLDHDPNHDDIRAFLGRLKTALQARDLTLLGITTEGGALFPSLSPRSLVACLINFANFISSRSSPKEYGKRWPKSASA
jgi:hypothetical protein